MPSRAVIRKKARREAKRSKRDSEKESEVPPKLVVDPVAETTTPVRSSIQRVPRRPAAIASPSHNENEDVAENVTENVAGTAPVPRAPRVVSKRPREPEVPEEPIPEGLSRKERRREVAKRILERQLARVNAAAAKSNPENGDAAQADMAERHDPRFSGGTFWRERKERRARTLFLGGLPIHMTSEQVKDFIHTVLDSDSLAVEYLNELAEGVDAIEEVDFLPMKHSRVRNAYVTLASVPIAGCAASKLDGYKLDSRFLRCNFAADKTQRSIAINRRSTR